MAEAVAAVSLAASILQLLNFGTEVIGRLHDYRTRSTEIPAVFHDISVQLPLLVADLRVTKERVEADHIKPFPVIDVSPQTLDEVLIKTMPSPTDSAWRTGKKVILSFRQEQKVRFVTEKLRDYVIYLTHHAVTIKPQKQDKSGSAVTQNDEQFRMLLWLSNDDPSIGYNRAVQQKQEGSGQWFLESKDFGHWRSSSHSFAWLYGIPLQEDLVTQTTSTVAYWYFDFDKSSSLDVRNMLRALIKQLCIGGITLPTAVQEMCAKYRASGQQPTTKVLLATLHSAIDSIRKKVFLVLDALDEYPENRRQELLAAVILLADTEHDHVHVLVTSRKEFDIEHALSSVATHQISIQGPKVDSDIRMHVGATLVKDARFSRLPPSIKDMIEGQLVTKAHSMFRWVDCQLETLRACNKISAIKQALDRLPVTLDETYERILRAIGPADSPEAYLILQWVAFAERPLTLEEIAEAAVTNEDGSQIDPEERLFDPYDVTRICKSLISLATDTLLVCGEWTATKVVRFAHFSVKEYLLSARVLEGKAKTYYLDDQTSHQQIGQSCLSILLQNGQIYNDQHSPLVQYAAQYWFQHLRKFEACTNDTSVFQNLVERLFVGSPVAFQAWLLTYDVNIRRAHDSKITKGDRKPLPSPLYYASFLGLEHVVRVLLKSGVDANVQGGAYCTALIAAASQGYLSIIRILLDHGADVDAKGSWTFFTALQAASYFGHESIAEVLLDKGAKPNRRRLNEDISDTALGLACEAGHKSIAEMLIDRGSDVNLLAGGYGYPLSAAAERGHYDVVRLLLRKGAKVNNEGGLYSTALQAAASAGSESILRLLLDEGAHVNVSGGVFSDAMRASSVRGHHGCVEILLEHGAGMEQLTGLLSGSTSQLPNISSDNIVLAEELQSAFATKDSISHLTNLVKRAHYQIRSQEVNAQQRASARPTLLRLQKLVKQAVQNNSGPWTSDLGARLRNAASRLENPQENNDASKTR
ncbi:MAG: hypothetical protein Q9170_003454 [Blastenia crenularia]